MVTEFSNTNKQTNNLVMENKQLLGIMSAIIYASEPQLAKDNGYAVINAIIQARELLNKIEKQTNKTI